MNMIRLSNSLGSVVYTLFMIRIYSIQELMLKITKIQEQFKNILRLKIKIILKL